MLRWELRSLTITASLLVIMRTGGGFGGPIDVQPLTHSNVPDSDARVALFLVRNGFCTAALSTRGDSGSRRWEFAYQTVVVIRVR